MDLLCIVMCHSSLQFVCSVGLSKSRVLPRVWMDCLWYVLYVCRRVGSQSHINIPTVNSSANLAATQQQQQQQLQSQLHQQQEHPYQQYQQYQQQQQQHTGSTPGHSRSTSDGGLAGFAAISGSRSGSGNLLSLLKQQQPHQLPGGGVPIVAAPVAPSVPRAEMTLLPPVMQQR